MTVIALTVPLSQMPAQKFRVVLNGQNCMISLYKRGSFMYMDLAVNRAQIITGAICLSGVKLVQYNDINFNGNLYFLDLNGSNAQPDYAEFNTRFALMYLSDEQ